MNRALPGPMIDLIRDGADARTLRASGDRAVYNALVRTATSALQRGWSYPEWAALVTESQSNLGRQASTRSGRKPRGKVGTEKLLGAAWGNGVKWVSHREAPWSADEARQQVAQRAQATRDFAADANADLDDLERAIIIVAADEAVRLGHDRPVTPWRIFAQQIDPTSLPAEMIHSRREPHPHLPDHHVREGLLKRTLEHLHHRGLLVIEDRGRASLDPGKRKGTARRLPTPEAIASHTQYRVPRSVGDPPVSMGGQDTAVWEPSQVYGRREEVNHMITVTISATDSIALREALDALAGRTDVHLHTAADDPDVIDINTRRLA